MELMPLRQVYRLEKQGGIQVFEAWNTLRDFLLWQGIEAIIGSRDTI